MVLEQLRDGAERHLEAFDEGTRQLITILCLPLVDGVFATLLASGALQSMTDYIMIALTIFSGAGSLAVLYSYSETRAEAKKMVFRATPVLVAGAVLVGLVAPVYGELFRSTSLSYTAALVLLLIAGKLAELDLADGISTSTVLITGLVLSVKSPGAVQFSTGYVVSAAATALFASASLYAATYMTHLEMKIDYIQKGSALVLILISLSVAGLQIPSEAGLAVFAVSLIASMRQSVRISN
ncbi:MAG: DUF5794 domain-containing protein [Candidatus Nanohaloarchaea archaeon]